MQIHVEISPSEQIHLNVEPNYTIEKVTTLIQDRFCLQLAGKQLENDHTLRDVGIQDKAIVELVTHQFYKIFVRKSDGKTLELNVETNYTIKRIKYMIQTVNNIPHTKQYLLFEGIILDDSHTLVEYNIQDDSILDLGVHAFCELYIYVKRQYESTCETLTIEVASQDTVANVITKSGLPKLGMLGTILKLLLSIQPSESLFFQGKLLENNKKLADYRIEDQSTLDLVIFSHQTFEIFVKLQDNRIITVLVKPYYTIEHVKSKVREHEHLPVECQINLFKGHGYEDTQTLSECNIQRCSTLEMFVVENPWVQISVKMPDGTMVNLRNSLEQSVKHLQTTIHRSLGLMFDGKILTKKKTLAQYNITDGATLNYGQFSARSMQLFVKMLTGKTICITAEPDDYIEDIKYRIMETEGIMMDQQRLIFHGMQLEDGKQLFQYGVSQEATLSMVQRLRGGSSLDKNTAG